MPSPEKRRILIFCGESRGLGHLRRLAQIADELAFTHAVLVVTSDLLAGDFIKPPVEFVRLPPLDSSDPTRTKHWDRGVFLEGLVDWALPLRTELLAATFRSFCPHAMITDFFATGRGGELLPHLQGSAGKCLNYLVLRGVLGDEAYARERIFSPQARTALALFYRRIFVACDARVLQPREYRLGPELESKCISVGYVHTPADETKRALVRRREGVKPGELWVVCSAGSGLSSEELIAACYRFAVRNSNYRFTLVLGPRSRLRPGNGEALPSHIRLRSYQLDLDQVLGSCDVAVVHGGYNSLLESVYGGAAVIVVPNEQEAEQREHATRLAALADVKVVEVAALDTTLKETLQAHGSKPPTPPVQLDLEGARLIAQQVSSDLAGALPHEA